MFKKILNIVVGIPSLRFTDRLLKLFGRSRVIIFVYHHVASSDDDLKDFVSLSHNVSPTVFKRQIDCLLENNIEIIDLAMLTDGRKPSPGLKVAITFDDGMKSVYLNAYPILRQHGIPFTIFLNSDFLRGKLFWRDVIYHAISTASMEDYLGTGDEFSKEARSALLADLRKSSKDAEIYEYESFKKLTSRYIQGKGLRENELAEKLYLSRDELKEMKHNGVRVANHSSSHPLMCGLTEAQIEEEFVGCHNALVDSGLMGEMDYYFALPFGTYESDSKLLRQRAKDLGYQLYLYVGSKANALNKNGLYYDRLLAATSASSFVGDVNKSVIRGW